eukprot:symbB.v1.2.006013.t1/scaffold356.1/size220710/10
MSATLASVTWAFFGFHTYLLCKNMTLREYLKPDRNGHMYDEGLCRNISQVMGEAWMFWLLPFTGPDGTGVEWGIEEAEVPESSNEFLQSSKALSSSMDNTHRCDPCFKSEDFSGIRFWTKIVDVSFEAASELKDSILNDPFTHLFKRKHTNFRTQWSFPEDFPSAAVMSAFQMPEVDRSLEPFSWASVDVRRVVAKLSEANLSEEKIMERLEPALRHYQDTLRQPRITEYLLPATGDVAVVRSTRMQEALRGLRGESPQPEPERPNRRRGGRAAARGSAPRARRGFKNIIWWSLCVPPLTRYKRAKLESTWTAAANEKLPSANWHRVVAKDVAGVQKLFKLQAMVDEEVHWGMPWLIPPLRGRALLFRSLSTAGVHDPAALHGSCASGFGT